MAELTDKERIAVLEDRINILSGRLSAHEDAMKEIVSIIRDLVKIIE